MSRSETMTSWRSRNSLPEKVSGFSLVELMIALALGTVIVLGAVGLLITNQQTFQLQQHLTDVQQQGGFTQGFMVNDLRQIGYEPDGATGAVPFGVTFSAITINGVNLPASSNGAATASDVLTFTFTGTQDCTGATSATQVQIGESYQVSGGDLTCTGTIDGASVTLLSGVTSFQVLYGMDKIENQQPVAATYATAAAAASMKNDMGNAAQVVVLRVAYLVQQNSGNSQPASNRDYMLLEQKLTDGTAPLAATNQIRREFVATIPVRNFDWTKI